MQWAPFKNLFWNTNEPAVMPIISITSGVSSWDRSCICWQILICQIMTAITNAENLRQYQSRFFWSQNRYRLFSSCTNLVREVKIISSNLKRVVIRTVRSVLSLNLNSSNKNNTQIACVLFIYLLWVNQAIWPENFN